MNKELGWSPSVTFEQGLAATIDWYLQNTAWLENVTSGAYQTYVGAGNKVTIVSTAAFTALELGTASSATAGVIGYGSA